MCDTRKYFGLFFFAYRLTLPVGADVGECASVLPLHAWLRDLPKNRNCSQFVLELFLTKLLRHRNFSSNHFYIFIINFVVDD